MDHIEFARMGGNALKAKDPGHFKRISKLGVEARKANKKKRDAAKNIIS